MASPLQLPPFGDVAVSAPIIITMIAAMGVLLCDLFEGWRGPVLRQRVAIGGLALAFAVLLVHGAFTPVRLAYYESLRFDRVVFLAQAVILAGSVFILLVSPRYLSSRLIPPGEFHALTLFATAGMMALAASNDLLALFVNIETLSITLYVLAGIERGSHKSSEAAFKYFLMGSYAAAFLLFGLTLVYGATGSTNFTAITAALESGKLAHPLVMTAGVALMLVGFGFKLTLAPFHMYAPDLYAGAPTPVTALIATGSKVGGLAVLLSFFGVLSHWAALPSGLVYALIAVTILTIVVGNAGALMQPQVRRLLAYSGVAHAGYAMVPLVAILASAGDPAKIKAILPAAESAISYFFLSYALMTLVAFGVVITLDRAGETIEDFRGLSRRQPWLAAVMALALISLTGVPPTAGFLGKFYLFGVAAEAGLYGLAIVGVLASVASAYYYLPIIVKMYMEPAGEAASTAEVRRPARLVLAACAIGIFLFGFFPMLYLLD